MRIKLLGYGHKYFKQIERLGNVAKCYIVVQLKSRKA